MRHPYLGASAWAVVALILGAAGAFGAPWHEVTETLFLPVVSTLGPSPEVSQQVLMQDQAGFIWAGGETGLARWDGYRFRVYSTSETANDGLPDHWVTAMHADSRGRLWVGTESGVLAHFDQAADHFITFGLPEQTAASGPVAAIHPDGQGGFWVAAGRALFHIDADDRVVDVVRHDDVRNDSLADATVTDMLPDRQGALWAGGPAGLAVSQAFAGPRMSREDRGAHAGFTAFPLPAPGGAIPAIICLFEDSARRIWVGTRQHGAFVLDADHRAAQAVPGSLTGAAPGAATEITAIAEVRPGVVWLGTLGHGIVEVEATSGPAAPLHARQIMRDPAIPNSLDANAIHALYRDRAGIVWVGTTAGLSEANWANPGISTMFGGHGAGAGLGAVDVTALLARPDGGLWVGSQNEGIDILDSSGRRAASLQPRAGRVYALATAPDGAVLAGTRSGLFVADARGEHIAKAAVAGGGPVGAVRNLAVLGADIWAGGTDDGVWRLRRNGDGSFATTGHFAASDLISAAVHLIAPGPGRTLVIGGQNGMTLRDTRSGAMERIASNPADPQGLGDGVMVSAAIDRHGRLWIGTTTSGISVMLGRDAAGRPRFHRIGTADGVPNLDINVILPDERGRMWVSTDSGIVVIDPDSFAIRAFGLADGVMNAPFWSGAGAVTAQGDLVFGGLDGLSLVHPDAAETRANTPPVVVTGVTVGGKAAMPRDGSVIGAPGGRTGIVVPADADSLAVEFAVLDYASAKRNLYRYRLDGFDTDWVMTDAAHRTAAYTNLPPGDYLLNLSGSDRNGAWSPSIVQLPVRVLPAWYQTLWARLGELVLGGSLVAAVVQIRTALLRRQRRELERQVALRTAELCASQEALHQLAYFDSLTTLPNRRAFQEQLAGLLERHGQAQSVFALMTIDLDGFKAVNDKLGHDAGDALLVIAGKRLRETVRQGDFVARLGGDEFAILLQDVTDSASIDTICNRIVSVMAEPITIMSATVRIGASVGVALCPRDGTSHDILYKRADVALYAAKQAGRGVWRSFDEAATATG